MYFLLPHGDFPAPPELLGAVAREACPVHAKRAPLRASQENFFWRPT